MTVHDTGWLRYPEAPEYGEVLAQFHWRTETIEVLYVKPKCYPYAQGGYRFEVIVAGGQHYLTEFRCATRESALNLFSFILDARRCNTDIEWLFEGAEHGH